PRPPVRVRPEPGRPAEVVPVRAQPVREAEVVPAEPIVEAQLATPEAPPQRPGADDIPVVYPVAMAAAMAARPGAPAAAARAMPLSPALAQVTALLRTPHGLRTAVLLREVLGTPLCHRRR